MSAMPFPADPQAPAPRRDEWPFDVERLQPGDACEYRYPARNVWRPATLVENGGPGWWRVHNDEAGEVGGLYIEFIRTPGSAHGEGVSGF